MDVDREVALGAGLAEGRVGALVDGWGAPGAGIGDEHLDDLGTESLDPGERARRAATVAVNALADAAVHGFYSDDRHGLRGGRFSVHGTHLKLSRVRFTDDTRASGSGTYDMATGRVEGKVSVAGVTAFAVWTPGMDTVTVKLRGAVVSVPSPL